MQVTSCKAGLQLSLWECTIRKWTRNLTGLPRVYQTIRSLIKSTGCWGAGVTQPVELGFQSPISPCSHPVTYPQPTLTYSALWAQLPL